MFNLGFGFKNELTVLALLGLGLYAQSNNISLANNTTTLLVLFLLFIQQQEIDNVKKEVYEDEYEEPCRQSHRKQPRSCCY